MGSAEFYLVAAVLLTAFSVYKFVSVMMANNVNKDVLAWASGKEPKKSKSGLINSSRPLVHQLTLQHAVRIKNPAYRSNIRRLLETAGMSAQLNVDEFIGLQILWGFAFPFLIGLLNFALDFGIPNMGVFMLIPLGAYLPVIQAKQERSRRELSVRRDLPFFADLLALSTKAGLDFISAIQRIVDKAEGSVLGEELGNVLKDIRLGASRADALKSMMGRLDLPEITSFIAVLVDADRNGASLSQVLKDQSNQIRLERLVRAEKAGARASQAILLPILIFILPAVFIVVFGPVIIQFSSGKI
jgi:tight adherence protein C